VRLSRPGDRPEGQLGVHVRGDDDRRGEFAVVAAIEVIDSGLQMLWTATGTQAGLASAYGVNALATSPSATTLLRRTPVGAP
jgi:hypothetical protein